MSVIQNNALAFLGADTGATGYQISRSLRFNSSDSAYLSRVVPSAGNRKTFTLSWWLKRSGLTTFQSLFNSFTDINNRSAINFDSSIGSGGSGDYLTMFNVSGGGLTSIFQTSALFRDASAWYHIVVAVDTTQATSSERVKLWVNNILQTFSTYNAPSQNADLHWNSAATHYFGVYGGSPSTTAYGFNGYLADVHMVDGQQLTPSSFGQFDANGIWQPKAYTGTYSTNGFKLSFSDNSTAAALGTDTSGNGNTWTVNNLSVTDAYIPSLPGSSYIDPVSGYYLNGNPPIFLTKKPNGTNIASSVTHGSSTGVTHSVNDVLQWAIDTSTGKIWFGRNNTWYASGDPASGANPSVDYGSGASYAAQNLYLGLAYNSPDFQLEMLTTPTYSIPSGFSYWSGATSGSWRGSGAKTSTIPNPNGDIFNTRMSLTGKIYFETVIKGGLSLYAVYGLMNVGESYTSTDSLVDSPTNYGTDDGLGGSVRGNYCTLNPLNVQIGAGSLTNGNLDLTGPSGSSAYNYAGGTFGIDTSTTTGWYFEYTQTTYGQFACVALLDQAISASSLNNLYAIGNSFANGTAGISYTNQGTLNNYGTTTTGLTSWTSNGDVIGVAIKDNKIWFAKNNTWISGSPSAGTSPSITLASAKYVTPAAIGINSSVLSFNAGQRPFAYTAPSGFKALCTTNLPEPTGVVAQPSTAMDVKLYTGNGSTQTISGLGFSPDFVWIKRRNSAISHALLDVIRGTNKVLYSNLTAAEDTYTDTLTAFNSDGFTLGSDATWGGVNASSNTYAAWCFDAGNSTVSNTQGSITSSVRANANAGFSVVTASVSASASGPTIGHGLGVTPALVIGKNRSSAISWYVWNASLPANNKLELQSTAAATTSTTTWGAMTSSTLQMGATGTAVNVSWVVSGTQDFVFYCFAPVAGYSSFGSYTGNGSSDGPFVYTGFRPRWVMVKRSDSTGNWTIKDTSRPGYNVTNLNLFSNLSTAETTEYPVDLLSNGFKVREGTFSDWNANGGTYVWAAFAEAPFQTARAR